MLIKGITDECFTDYKAPAMLIAMPTCSFKCDKENGCKICQNSKLAQYPSLEIDKNSIIERYLKNSITKAIIFGGLEPFDSPMDLASFIDTLRRQYKCEDPVIIYTGYTECEILNGEFNDISPIALRTLVYSIINQKNIIIKYGRFLPNEKFHYDEILGVNLASKNQYAKEYNYEDTSQP